MTLGDFAEMFARHSGEHGKFDRVEPPAYDCRDLCAFVLLARLIPHGADMIAAAGHDEITLSTDVGKLAEVITEPDVIALIRCGVRYDGDDECLRMFV